MSEPPAVLDCDVLVAGGGVSGVSAAVSAARRGCRVALVEKHSQLGGTGTRGLLSSIGGLYLNGDAVPADTLNNGIVREIVSALRARSPQRTIAKTGSVYVLPYESRELGSLLRQLCSDEPNLTVLLGSAIHSVSAAKGQVSEAAVKGKQNCRIRPCAVVDATGSAELAFLAGAEFDLSPPENRQMAGYTVRVRGLADRDGLELKVPFVLAKAGSGPRTLKFTTFAAGQGPDDGYLKFNSSEPEGPDREQHMQADVAAALELLASRLLAFKHASVAETSRAVIDREGRRIRGEYTLTEDDVISGRTFPDGAVRNAWPIELWDQQKGTVYRFVPKGAYYEIPFRSLKAKSFGNLLAAGRCISATHEALGSIRVMGCCMATGDAAGRAAAALVRNGAYGDYRLNA